MESQGTNGVIAPQEWLMRSEDARRHVIHRAFRSAGPASQKVRNTLHGTWLGHPLHTALTDVPVGAQGREFRIATDSRMTLGRTLSALGYAVGTVAGRMGGNRVYDHRVGVDHTTGRKFAGGCFACAGRVRTPGRRLAAD